MGGRTVSVWLSWVFLGWVVLMVAVLISAVREAIRAARDEGWTSKLITLALSLLYLGLVGMLIESFARVLGGLL